MCYKDYTGTLADENQAEEEKKTNAKLTIYLRY
jgi:hypothetical protein